MFASSLALEVFRKMEQLKRWKECERVDWYNERNRYLESCRLVERKFTCDVCEDTFTLISDLDQFRDAVRCHFKHKKHHQGGKKCQVCKKSVLKYFKDNEELFFCSCDIARKCWKCTIL